MQRTPSSSSLLAIALCAAAWGCDAGPGPVRCTVGADCASGICLPDHTCAAPQDRDAGPRTDAGSLPDGSATDAGAFDGGSSGLCRPNGDGVITREEAPFGPNLMARYVTALDVGVDSAGSTVGGTRTWDYAGSLPGDRNLDLDTGEIAGRWFADRYPGADYVVRLSGESELLGVFRTTATSLELLGVVSPTDGVTRTQLTYAPAVKVLVFPLQAGARWTSDVRVTGFAEGLAVNYGEVYENEVDAAGEVITPYAPFDALRVRVTLTRDLTFSRVTVRQLLFVTECFGTIATLVSEEGETQVEFDRAAEIRRLGF
ncbi:MAG: hypothetical protein AB7S26_09710 [Sandaracinaceae bacterium]